MHCPTKRCSLCGEWKPYYDFHHSAHTRDGCRAECVLCHNAYVKDYSEQHDKRVRNLVRGAKRRAVVGGLCFDLDQHIDKLILAMGSGCALTGLAFDMTMGVGNNPLGPSLDRVKAGKGYVIVNVRIICRAMNSFIGEWGTDAIRPIALAFLENNRG